MLKKIFVGVSVVVVVLAVIVALQPARFRVVRTATIAAPAGVVFAQVNDFHKWQAWSPWAKLDPAMKNTFSGPPQGAGAVYAWVGNDKVGEGRMTITDSRPDALIRIRLEFRRPFVATNTTEFTFRPDGGRALVGWSMTGDNNFVGKAIHLVMDMDTMVGGDFERGLARLDAAQAAGAPERQCTREGANHVCQGY